MRILSLATVLLLSTLLALGAGCSNDPSGSGLGTMSVHMTDDPGDFESVNLVITEVSAHLAGLDEDSDTTSDGAGGWIVLEDTPATYDLLELQNGVFANIGTARVPAGHYTQIRLKLASGSTVVIDGVAHPLIVPSGLQTGLKLVGSFDVPEDGLLDVALDFDAARSIDQDGTGAYRLEPTVKVLPFRTAGSISGHIAPAGTAATIYALQAPDTLGSTTAAADGAFTLAVLASGTYDVAIHPASGYRDTTRTGVVVAPQQTTDVGTIELTAE